MAKSIVKWLADDEESTEKWAKDFLESCLSSGISDGHFGDCTKDIHPCSLCVLEQKLSDYFDYCKEQKQIK